MVARRSLCLGGQHYLRATAFFVESGNLGLNKAVIRWKEQLCFSTDVRKNSPRP